MIKNIDPEDEFYDRKADEYEDPIDFDKKAQEKELYEEDRYGW